MTDSKPTRRPRKTPSTRTRAKNNAKKPKAVRCFFGLAYPLATQLQPLYERLEALAADPATQLRPTPVKNLHVTLKFLGSLPETSLPGIQPMMLPLMARYQPFEMRSYGLGLFRNSIWVGIEANPALTALAGDLQELAQSLGVAVESQPYTPHVTVARFGREDKVSLSALQEEFAETEWGSFKAHKLRLYRSDTLQEGARYTTIDRFDLGFDAQDLTES